MPIYDPKATAKLEELLTHYVNGEYTTLLTPFTQLKDNIRGLIEAGANPAAMPQNKSTSLLHLLIYHACNGIDNEELIKKILAIDNTLIHVKNGNHNTPLQSLMNLYSGLQCGSAVFKSLAMLLATETYGADLTVQSDTYKNTILHLYVLDPMVTYTQAEIERLVLLNPKLLNIKNILGRTPIHHVIRVNQNVSVNDIRILCSAENLNERDNDHETLLHAASISGNLQVAQHLRKGGLQILEVTKEKNTMLHCAVHHKNAAMWQWLFDNRVDLNAQNSIGQTALHLACIKNNSEMVEWLIRSGAKLSIKNNKGETPLQWAINNGMKALAITLFKAENPLLTSIHELHHYGVILTQKGALKEGKVAVTLAAELQIMAYDFFKNNAKLHNFEQFRDQFRLKLNSKNKDMLAYRADWNTILKNVAIALTGIGALLILGHLLYTTVNGYNPLFLFQKSRTTRHDKLVGVVDSLEYMGRMERLDL